MRPAIPASAERLFHGRIADAASRDQHAQGWDGRLDGLVEYLAQ